MIRGREGVAAGRSPDGWAGGAEEDVGGKAAGRGEVGDAAVVSGEPLAGSEGGGEFREGQLVGGAGGNSGLLECRGDLSGLGIFLAFPCHYEAAADEFLLMEVLEGGEPAFSRPDFPWAAAAWVDGEGAAAGGGGQLEGVDRQVAGEGVGELAPGWPVRLHDPWSLMDVWDAALPESLPGDAFWIGEP